LSAEFVLQLGEEMTESQLEQANQLAEEYARKFLRP